MIQIPPIHPQHRQSDQTVSRYSAFICDIWGSEKELRSMITSNHFRQLAALRELSSEPPDCRFRFISKTQGLEFAEQIKGYPPHRQLKYIADVLQTHEGHD